MTWLNGPLLGFDVETTGVDTETARIVTAAIGKADKPGAWRSTTELVNPGVPIPPEASAVHHITDERAANGIHPIKAVAWIDLELQAAWASGAPVIAYNAVFDLSILDREMRRHLGRPLEISGPVIDPLVLDKAVDRYLAHLKTCAVKKGGDCDCGNSRRLSDTCKRYGITLTEEAAHTAGGDCYATIRLAWCVITKHRLDKMSLDGLHAMQRDVYVEQRTSFFDYLRRKGETPDDTNTVWPMAPFVAREEAGVAT